MNSTFFWWNTRITIYLYISFCRITTLELLDLYQVLSNFRKCWYRNTAESLTELKLQHLLLRKLKNRWGKVSIFNCKCRINLNGCASRERVAMVDQLEYTEQIVPIGVILWVIRQTCIHIYTLTHWHIDTLTHRHILHIDSSTSTHWVHVSPGAVG